MLWSLTSLLPLLLLLLLLLLRLIETRHMMSSRVVTTCR
jgi:hypothetical protein